MLALTIFGFLFPVFGQILTFPVAAVVMFVGDYVNVAEVFVGEVKQVVNLQFVPLTTIRS